MQAIGSQDHEVLQRHLRVETPHPHTPSERADPAGLEDRVVLPDALQGLLEVAVGGDLEGVKNWVIVPGAFPGGGSPPG